MPQTNPVLVEVTRGPAVESVHRGAAVVVGETGRVVRCWGDIERSVYPRSGIKPLQAVPLIASGAAASLQVSATEIALACASHNGEPVHTSGVEHWLKRIGYGPGTLECGVHPPMDNATRRELKRRGGEISPLHNNCSGKHAGFLTVCRHLGFDPAGYIRAEHPIQQLVWETVAEFTGSSLNGSPRGVDGCGIPVYGIALRRLATAMMKFAHPEGLDPNTVDAVKAIREAMVAHPYLVAGRERFCTALMQALAPRVIVKTGAEGVFCAAVLDRGLGIALKIDDGATRASEVALGGILRMLGAISDSQFSELRSKLEPEVVNAAGIPVGVIQAARPIGPGP